MTDVWDRDASSAGPERRTAFRAAQQSTTNIYAFRRLRWGMPRPRNRSAGGRRRFTVADLMIVVIVFSAFGFVAALAWPH
jgi:hypothetical protein